jgi:hypothetical protein
VVFLAAGQGSLRAAVRDDPPSPVSPGVQVVTHAGYPELRVDGAPFFIHGATFDYFRIPRDLWEPSLDHYRELGINTLDLTIPWNWHEPRQGELDFDGHSNPRRDLRGLLRMLAEKRFHLVVRLAPAGVPHWRQGGYPEWLLSRPELKMDPAEVAAGRVPPLAAEEHGDADAAARAWVEIPAHMAAVRAWLAAVAWELAPYNSSRRLRVPQPDQKSGETRETEISGPLLFVQLEESPGLDVLPDCSHFWQYVGTLRQALATGGVDALSVVNPVTPKSAGPPCTPPQGTPVFFTGRWTPALRPDALVPDEKAADSYGERQVTGADASAVEFLSQTLQLQTEFPLLVSNFQPGSFAPDDDVGPPAIAPENTLLGSRLLLAQGLQGLEYAPLQDTLTPPGFATLEASRFYRWDAALSLSGQRQPQALGVARNAQIVAAWGTFLAASHRRPDFALVDPRRTALGASSPGLGEQARAILERVAAHAGLSVDLVDPDSQPLEILLRYPAVLLPVRKPPGHDLELSASAQAKLVEFVRRGGALVVFPGRPEGSAFEPLWSSPPTTPAPGAGSPAASWRFGQGRVVVWAEDFAFSSESRLLAATESLLRALAEAGARPAIKRKGSSLLVTERVSHAGTGLLGARLPRCSREDAVRDSFGPLCNRGLLSVTNLSYEETASEQLLALSPGAGVRGPEDDYLPLDLQVPAHESLLLPLEAPLCAEDPRERCEDEVVIAGAELLRAERDGKAFLLTFYTPSRATILLRLESQPTKISIGDINLEGKWTPHTNLLEVSLPRGAAPDYLRVVKIQVRYTPHLPERLDPGKRPRRNFDAEVVDAVPLPLGPGASLPSYPPLILLGPDRRGSLLYRAKNHDVMGRDIGVKIEGSIRGTGRIGLDPNEMGQEKLNVGSGGSALPGRDAETASPPQNADGVYTSELLARSGRFERNLPLAFVAVGPELPVLYQFDFDRDAAKEWVLENSRLRLIVSPDSGGRAVALVDKRTSANLTTPIGALRDFFSFPSADGGQVNLRDFTFNRAYTVEKVEEQKSLSIRLRYRAPELAATGVEIEKTLRFSEADTLAVEYRLTSSDPAENPPAFVVGNSLPAQAGGDRSTRFCWAPPGSPEGAALAPSASNVAAAATDCTPFTPGGAAIVPPAGVKHLLVRTPGQPGLLLAWEEGHIRIEPKTFSALLLVEFPAAKPGGSASRFNLRYTVLPVQ